MPFSKISEYLPDKTRLIFASFAFLIFLTFMNTPAQSESKNVPNDWQTLAEQTDYQKSWRYTETIAFAQKLGESVAVA